MQKRRASRLSTRRSRKWPRSRHPPARTSCRCRATSVGMFSASFLNDRTTETSGLAGRWSMKVAVSLLGNTVETQVAVLGDERQIERPVDPGDDLRDVVRACESACHRSREYPVHTSLLKSSGTTPRTGAPRRADSADRGRRRRRAPGASQVRFPARTAARRGRLRRGGPGAAIRS